MKKALVLAIIVSATLLGCKKKDDAGTADLGSSAGSGSAAPVVVPPAPPVVPPSPPPPSGSGGGSGSAAAAAAAPAAPTVAPVASSDDYKTRGPAFVKQLMAVFDEKDCDKLAAAITSFVDSHKGESEAINAWEKAHPDDKKAVGKQMAQKQAEFQKRASSTIEKCKDNKALQEALEKLPE